MQCKFQLPPKHVAKRVSVFASIRGSTSKEILVKDKVVILRNNFRITRDIFDGTFSFPQATMAGEVDLRIDVDEVTRRELQLLSNDATVVGTAPIIPMRLIEPKASAIVSNAAAGAEWGIVATRAHTSPFDGTGVTVAVLDTGIDETHPAFSGVSVIKKNFTSEVPYDTHGHGTHCAATIFGRDLSGRRIGIARGVSKAIIAKVLGGSGGASDKVAEAILWSLENGANVISMSLGIDFTEIVNQLVNQGLPIQAATSRALEGYRANVKLFESVASLVRAQQQFGKLGVLIAAAGNESERPSYEIAVAPPAVSEGFISVAALAQSPTGYVVADFSNVGANVSAPGVNVVSAKVGGGLVSMSGTSMATPHVAGIAALWTQKLMTSDTLTAKQLEAKILSNAELTGFIPTVDRADIGAGIVIAPQ
jgi:subtilisin family serine protease